MIAQLDSAILFLAAAPGPPNVGPPADNAELIYLDRGGNTAALAAVYTQVAHSLKARYYMHLAEVNPANYALALAEVPLGINSPANDMLWYHDQSPTGQNVWWQFMGARGDIAPGAALIEILKRRIAAGVETDERLNFYFNRQRTTRPRPRQATSAGRILRLPARWLDRISQTLPGSTAEAAHRPLRGPADDGGDYSTFNFINNGTRSRGCPDAGHHLRRNPADRRRGGVPVGGQGAAQPFLDAARANRSYGARGATPITFTPLAPVPATLENIMEEKYVTLYPQHRGMERLQADLPAGAGLGAGVAGQHDARDPSRYRDGCRTESRRRTPIPTRRTSRRRGGIANDPNPCPLLNYTSSVRRWQLIG